VLCNEGIVVGAREILRNSNPTHQMLPPPWSDQLLMSMTQALVKANSQRNK
jgi:hypothetical protein